MRNGPIRLIGAAVITALAWLALAAAPGAAARPGAAAQAEEAASLELRVLSYNIRWGYANGQDPQEHVPDLERTAAAIRAHDPDVVTLQEVLRNHPRGGDVYQAQRLAELLDMHFYFGDNRPDREERKGGNAILSRYPITDTGNTLLTSPDGGAQRGLAYALLDVGGTDVRVYTTHLAHDSASLRQQQAEELLAETGRADGPVLLTGDFNARPTGTVAELVADHGFVDTWTQTGSADFVPGYTFPADAPDRRIDYVFASPDWTVLRGTVGETEASDHRPVVIDLTIP